MVFQILLCGECYENVQDEQWIVCTYLSVNAFITLATHSHLEYHCKALFKTLCISGKLSLNLLVRVKS
jgi:hypothetical protein